jgi:hypothetical protein
MLSQIACLLSRALSARAEGETKVGSARLVSWPKDSTLRASLGTTVGLFVLAGAIVAGIAGSGFGIPPPATNSIEEPAHAGKADAVKPDGAAPGDHRKRLSDPDPQVRLEAALRLPEQMDEQAINALIELLGVLPAAERRRAESALQQVAAEWSPNPALAGDDEISRRILRDAWAGWWRNVDGPALLAAFQKRTLSKNQTVHAMSRIAELDADVYETRERATAEIVTMGSTVVPLLRQAQPGASLEQRRRIERCIRQIAEAKDDQALPAVAARLLALRKPAGRPKHCSPTRRSSMTRS